MTVLLFMLLLSCFFSAPSSSFLLPSCCVCPTTHLFCLFLCSMGPEFDPVETASNDVQDEMPQLVKPPSAKEEFYNRSTAAA